MNPRYTSSDQNGFTMHDQRLLDLLVDGELPEDQRSDLLAGLDHAPDGWRRCALAFLEAQSWQQEMGVVVRERADDSSEHSFSDDVASIAKVPRPIVAKAHGVRTIRAFSMPLAMAASLLVAFSLGLAVRPPSNETTTGGAGNSLSSTNAVRLAAQNPSGSEAQEPADRPLPGNDGTGRPGTGRWGTAKLVVDNGPDGEPREVELAAVESDSWDESLLTSSPAAIPPELQRVFERLGHQVRQERQLVSFELDDGRQMVVPVDKVSFTPLASRSYQ